MAHILDTIIAHKRQEIARLRQRYTQDELEAIAANTLKPHDFLSAILGAPSGASGGDIPIIAEIKKASPSKGVIRRYVNPAAIARMYEAGGAAALSVLTDRRFFQGRPESLARAKAVTRLPALRKDFILTPEQVWESRALHADAVLLIVAALEAKALAALIALVERLGMTALVEVHTGEELSVALDAGARCIGVNNRDLTTFAVDIGVTEKLLLRTPRDIPVISESGLRDHATLVQLRDAGVSAFLVGEAFMAAADPRAAVRALVTGASA